MTVLSLCLRIMTHFKALLKDGNAWYGGERVHGFMRTHGEWAGGHAVANPVSYTFCYIFCKKQCVWNT